MSDLKEYLDLKKQYEKIRDSLDPLAKKLQKVGAYDELFDVVIKPLSELSGWFLVRMQDLEEKAK